MTTTGPHDDGGIVHAGWGTARANAGPSKRRHCGGGPTSDGVQAHHVATGFGAALRAARLAAGLSQVQLAERAGIVHSYVSRLESGVRMPASSVLMLLCDALDADDELRTRLFLRAGFVPLWIEPEALADVVVAAGLHRAASKQADIGARRLVRMAPASGG